MQKMNEETSVAIILNLVPNLLIPRANSWNTKPKIL